MCLSLNCIGQESPNFLWLICEDQSLFFSVYGDTTAKTPNLDLLANDGLVYKNCHTPSPVCAPSRSSLITECIQQLWEHNICVRTRSRN